MEEQLRKELHYTTDVNAITEVSLKLLVTYKTGEVVTLNYAKEKRVVVLVPLITVNVNVLVRVD